MVKLADSDGTNYETFATESENLKNGIQLSHDEFGQSKKPTTSAALLAQKNTRVVQSVLAKLLVWVGLHSSYPVDQVALPEVVELTPERLTIEAYADVPELLPASGVDERILRLYADDDGTNGTI